jgi:hypothetical protein
MHYGPQGTWHELFIAYPPTTGDTLARRGYIGMDRPLWSIGDTRGVQHHLDDLSRLLSNPAALADQIDRIDRSCEQLILESLMGAAATPKEGSADQTSFAPSSAARSLSTQPWLRAVSGSRSSFWIRPIAASAALTGMGLVSRPIARITGSIA